MLARKTPALLVLIVLCLGGAPVVIAAEPTLPSAAKTLGDFGELPGDERASSLSFNTSTDLETQLASALQAVEVTEEQIKRAKLGIKRARMALPALGRRRNLAEQEIASLQDEQRVHRSRVKKASDELNKLTLTYVTTIQQLGQNGQQIGGDDKQLFDYLGDASPQDAVLIYQIGGSFLNDQAAQLGEVRVAATELAVAKQKLDGVVATQLTTIRASDEAIFAKRRIIESLGAELQELERNQLGQTEAVTRLRQYVSVFTAAQINDNGVAGDTGGVLTQSQVQFATQLAATTGLDVNVVKAWSLAEMSGSYATQREAEGNHNILNIGYFDSLGGGGAFQGESVWSNTATAAYASAAFLQGEFLGASPGIQSILNSVGQSPEVQINAIAVSGWASSGYGGGASIRGTYKLVPHSAQPPRIRPLFRLPDGKIIRL